MSFRKRTAGARPVGWALGLLLFGGAACRDEQAGPPKSRPPLAAPRKAMLLNEAPTDLTHSSGATLSGGVITYFGSRVVPPKPSPGQTVTVSHYFRANAPPPQGFAFFVHVLDAQTGQQVANLDHEIQNGALPLARWPVGKVVEDTHSFQMPGALGSFRLGLGFWQGETRLPVDAAEQSAGENRLRGPTIESPAAAPLPEYRIRRAAKPPTIDGQLNDAVWQTATPITLVGSYDGRRPVLRTVARLSYDDVAVYLAFDCEDPDVWGTLRKRDDAIYNEEVVEAFFDANGDGLNYNELEVSPHNVIFDAFFPSRRQGMDLTYDAQMQTAVNIRGTIDNPSDKDEGWTVEIRVPLARLSELPNLPPKPGDQWRFNLYRLEHLERRSVEGQAFSPLFIGDFHALPRFGKLIFE